MTEYIHKNEVTAAGTVLAPPAYSHENHRERFYKFPLQILRLSAQADELMVVVSETLLAQQPLEPGMHVALTGQLRSYNNKSGQGNRLIITVFAKTLAQEAGGDCNEIHLTGVICKPPVRRRTPLGREICDIMLAVNRRYGRADYIPCIAWGALAGALGELNVGAPLSFAGRVQSRSYTKLTEQGPQTRVAFEVSVMCLTEDGEDIAQF